ncbi:amidase domain-containing protein [Paenibacillus elgii]
MMFGKKIAASAIMLFALTSAVAFADDTTLKAGDAKVREEAQKFVVDFVGQAYKPYYTLNTIDSDISEYSVKDNVLTARVNISLSKTLKAKSVDEIPYVKGMKGQSAALKQTNAISAMETEQVISDRVKDLSEYIGTATEQNDSFRLTAKVVNGVIDNQSAKLEFLNYMDWIPAAHFIPETEETMMKHGQKDLMEAVTTNRAYTVRSAVQPQAAFTYNRIAARDYANRYTSTVTSSPYYDTSKWNKNYKFHTESGGVDCANYVSQAMYAGGIPTDSTWKPESIAWVNTGRNISNGLEDYMVRTKKYFYKTTKATTPAGGFISALDYSHVMFVVANDTVTMQYSAHTNDKLKASFANFSDSKFEFFYINSAYLN